MIEPKPYEWDNHGGTDYTQEHGGGYRVLTQKYVNEISYQVIGSAIEVHKHLGPGLLESVYEMCLIDELISRGLDVKTQIYLPVTYKGKNLGGKLKIDMLVNNLVII